MKKLIFILSVAVTVVSCTKDKSNIDEKKYDRSAEEMRNYGLDSSALSSEQPSADSISVKDSAK